MRVQYVLEEQEAIKTLNAVMNNTEVGNMTQYRRVFEAYKAWKKRNCLAHIVLLSSMDNDLMREFKFPTVAKAHGKLSR